MTIGIIIFLIGCSDEDPVQVMKWADQFFPMEVGDTWYYTLYDEDGSPLDKITRQVEGDINIDGIVCTPIYDGDGFLEQCWVKDSVGLHIHLFLYFFEPDPPLLIPFNLRSDRPYEYGSIARQNRYPYREIEIKGKMTLEGYVTRSVPAGTFKNCLELRYDEAGDYPETYYEYYAPGVGLLDDGTIVLDSAVVGGVRYP
jgi:hypothetical protein